MVSRRQFGRTIGTTAAASVALPRTLKSDEPKPASVNAPETLVKKLYDSLSVKQREEICFPREHKDDRGVLRTRVSNNWQIVDVWVNASDDPSVPTNAAAYPTNAAA